MARKLSTRKLLRYYNLQQMSSGPASSDTNTMNAQFSTNATANFIMRYFTTSQLYLTWGGVDGRETILCDILIFSRGENRLDGTIGFVRYNKLNFATDLQKRKCML